ncbi:MAG: type IX secretion system outer membrane channel protein PorV [Tannerellaceae bacterium]|nr:type IX secretion system outer membrane channel protein PorV [Tannerellaceae bacterium]
MLNLLRTYSLTIITNICLMLCAGNMYGQESELKTSLSPPQTAIPSLTVAPDARSSGMGDAGIASEPDTYSQHWNPAKYSFTYSSKGIGISYTPWLRKWVKDMHLLYAAGYIRFGREGEQALATSVRYFSLGEINGMQNDTGMDIPPLYPYEMAIDVSYSRKLSRNFSLATAVRYVRSDMGIKVNEERYATNAVCIDLAGYGEHYFIRHRAEYLWSWGFHIANVGNRVSYDGGLTYLFLPATLRIGAGLLYPLSRVNHLGIYFDIHKYLVPSSPESNSWSSFKGIVHSFSDIQPSFSWGVEYRFENRLFLRTGYYHENKRKSNRQYVTGGAGVLFRGFQVDISYLMATGKNNPLDSTLRLSLSFEIEEIRKLL